MKNILKLLLVCAMLPACDNSEKKDAERIVENIINNKNEDNSAGARSGDSPCSLLSETMVNRILEIPEQAPSEIRDEVLTFPTCSYKWKTIKYSKKQTIAGKEMTLSYPATLLIVMVENASTELYNRSVKVYKDGLELKSVGEKAVWGDAMSQLTFLKDGNLIHLNVKLSLDKQDNKDKAIALANAIIENL